MRTPDATAADSQQPLGDTDTDRRLSLRPLLRFADPAFEQRFIGHYVSTYLRYAQVSLLLGVLLVFGDYAIDRMAHGASAANALRLTAAIPVLLSGLGYTLLPRARLGWQPVMAAFIFTIAVCLFTILARLDAEGGQGLRSWVGILNFTFLEFYCFVILGLQFRYALVSGVAILLAFVAALPGYASFGPTDVAYWSYHVVTLFILAAGLGWWREFLLRKEFVARISLDDSRAAAERWALQLAHYDDVTGLPNRRLFATLATPTLERTRRGGTGCAILHVQVTGLSAVNHLFGRSHADGLVADIAQRLRNCIRGSDIAGASVPVDERGVVARLGDSAFSVLVADIDSQERTSLVAQRLAHAVSQPIKLDSTLSANPIGLAAHIGIAMFPGDADELADLCRCAEHAARVARDGGGSQHAFFDEALNARARERLQLEGELRQALQDDQLHLHYQPKIDVRDGSLVGAEALVRWQHPTRGLLGPSEFIDLAEDSGLIGALTERVMQAACCDLRRWADAGLRSIPISVNLPAPSLADPALPERLETLLSQHALHPSRLVLELTETMVMRDMDAAVDVLVRLRGKGFGLSLDDFGTGYSSLTHLRNLPIGELKIDRSFITDVAHGGRDAAIAISVITLARELGLRTVAEGVENTAQSSYLQSRGCWVQQGFLFSGPVAPSVFENQLRAGHLYAFGCRSSG